MNFLKQNFLKFKKQKNKKTSNKKILFLRHFHLNIVTNWGQARKLPGICHIFF